MTKHICFITPSLVLGGAERSLVKVANGYVSLGNQVTIISFSNTPGLQELLNDQIILYSLPNLSSSNPVLWIRIFYLLKRITPDTIFGWSLYGNLVAALLTLKLKSANLILSERIYLPFMLNKSKRHKDLRSCIVLFAIKKLYPYAHTITANSQQNLRFLKKYIGNKPRYIQLPNMINLHEISKLAHQRISTHLPVTKLKILAVGRLCHQKGFDILIRAMREIQKTQPMWSFLIVGDGPAKKNLMDLVEQYGLAQNVHWAGAQINPFPYYKWADIVVVPSRFEGFPNVPLEAMACGTPVVCADCKTGPYELTCGGKFGVLVPVEDASSLAHAIMKLGKDKKHRKALGIAGYNHIKGTYTDQVVRSQMTKVLALN